MCKEDMTKELFPNTGITRLTTLIRPIGGNRMVHAINCDYIAGWNIEGCTAVSKFNPNKMAVCPTCEALVYLASGAKDFVSNKDKYKKFVQRFSVSSKTLYSLVFICKCKFEIVGERLYVRKKNDVFYIDFTLDDVRLFHNNYNVSQRNESDKISATAGGFHEHPLITETPVERVQEAMKQLIRYKYEKARETHEKKKKSQRRITFNDFDQLDPEYWGF